MPPYAKMQNLPLGRFGNVYGAESAMERLVARGSGGIMLKKTCIALVLLLTTFPVLAAGPILIHGGLAADSAAVSPTGFLGDQEILSPAPVRDSAQVTFEATSNAIR